MACSISSRLDHPSHLSIQSPILKEQRKKKKNLSNDCVCIYKEFKTQVHCIWAVSVSHIWTTFACCCSEALRALWGNEEELVSARRRFEPLTEWNSHLHAQSASILLLTTSMTTTEDEVRIFYSFSFSLFLFLSLVLEKLQGIPIFFSFSFPIKIDLIVQRENQKWASFRLCLVPENLKENARKKKYKGKVEGKKKWRKIKK